ncbi:acyl-CoA thioesterase [Faecalicatena contorta]|uniref:Acyl-CoA thioester hydrolase n=1 Tax=Faecalicatena contorta TaxID=39482 RepID=A0A316AKI1_9FIRM|nr:thioesterase family protein [Faecalicatena contorta]PWJ50517.1 acyl-CoA thioester hydrolase [Faecalicatena contorta]SUQ13925.1 acyl-CoA thioester hydrolase [Faecalicatena contorta]
MNIKPYVRKTHYYETDQMAIIHHANYIHWMEEARVDFMEQMGFSYERAVSTGIDFALLGISCEYKSMVRFGDTVNIQVSISALSAAKMTVQYEITDAATGKLRTVGESSHCYFDANKKRPVSLKKVLPELYDLFAELYESTTNCMDKR